MSNGQTAAAPSLEQMLQRCIQDAFNALKQEFLVTVAEVVERELQQKNAVKAAPARYIKTREAAEIAGVCKKTIRNWVKSGALKRYTAGRSLRIDRGELQTYLLAERAQPSTADIRTKALEILSRA